MENLPIDDIEELALCSSCKLPFDNAERLPKILGCKHYFCLACTSSVLGDGRTAHCVHCSKTTELPGGRAAALPTHAAVLALALRLSFATLSTAWCGACGARASTTCELANAPHTRPTNEALAMLRHDARQLAADVMHLTDARRDFLLSALEAATALKLHLESELAAPRLVPTLRASATPEAASAERDQLLAMHADTLLQARLDDLVRNASAPLELEPLRRACGPASPGRRDPLLLLANYCMAQLYMRRRRTEADASDEPARPLSPYPLFYFELEVDCVPTGRVVVEVRDDAAPRMAHNFAVLTTGELGVGYRGCTVFQCWENESVITGDYEQNNGRGGRSAYEEGYFIPENTRMSAVRGAVGMRRSQKRRNNFGLVGSQFRIMLREMRGFTAIFAFVAEGLELVDHLSRTGDSAGNPHSCITIAACGRLN